MPSFSLHTCVVHTALQPPFVSVLTSAAPSLPSPGGLRCSVSGELCMVPGAKKHSRPSPATLDWCLQQLRSSRWLKKASLPSPPPSFPSSPSSGTRLRQEAEVGLDSLAKLRLEHDGTGAAAASEEGKQGLPHQGGSAPASQGSSSEGRMEGMVELIVGSGITSWPPRKPLVQWAVQLETYGAGRFAPHHAGAHPNKSCLKERRAGQELGADDMQLEKLSAAVPKSAIIQHPKPVGPIVGVKRSRMAAFR